MVSFKKVIKFLCFVWILINVNMTAYAEEVAPEDAAASLTLADSTTKYYDSVSEAFSAAQENNGCTLQLLKSVKYGSELGNHITISAGEFTIDLNGNTLDFSETMYCLWVKGGKLTFIDSCSGKTGTIKGKASAVHVTNNGYVIFQGGNYKAETWAVVINGDITAEVTGGYFEAGVGMDVSKATRIDISGGEFCGTG